MTELNRSNLTPKPPWRSDPTYGGMSDEAARKSWQASQVRAASHSASTPSDVGDRDLLSRSKADPWISAQEPVEPPTLVNFVRPSQWANDPPPPVPWLARNRIPRGDVSTLHGDGGSGKTDIALQLCAACAREAQDWLGSVIAPGPAIFLSVEEPETEIRRRLHRLAERDNYDLQTLANLHIWFPDPLRNSALALPNGHGIMCPTSLFTELERRIARVEPVLVMLDNVAAIFAGSQNDRLHVRTFSNLFRRLAQGPSQPAVLLLDHPSLSGMSSGSGRGGNMDWRNCVRSALYLQRSDNRAEADAGVRVLEVVKSNYGPIGEKVKLRWSNGSIAVEEAPDTIQLAARDRTVEEKFLELLDLRNQQGRHVGDKPSSAYAPKVFAEGEDSGRCTKQAFAKAMDRLFKTHRITLERVGPPSDNRRRIVRTAGSVTGVKE